MRRSMRWNLPLLGLITGFLVSGSGACLAQNTDSGDLRGTATDSSGAVVPGVTVTVTDVDKGVVRSYVTDAAGLYDTGAIPPDHYLVKFGRDGFETYVRGPVTVTVGIQTVDAILQVGQVSQQVVVTTDVPMLNTESGALEGDMQSSTMSELPQVGSQNGGGADWENFVILMPGAAGAPENSSSSTNPGTIASINGNLPYASVLQDGATTTLPMSQNSDVTVFETTSEVKVSATAFSAQYGVGDIVYNQITKSGTDQFHGAAYEYNQNTALNAANYAFGTGKVNIVHFNNFGGAIGGPVLPRHIFHKSFFYFDYDRTINNGTGSVKTVTLPSTAMMGGDFTQAGLPTLYDPTTQTILTTGNCTYTGAQYTGGFLTTPAPCVQRKSFISEYGSNKIPAGMIDPAAAAIQKYLLTTTGFPANVASYSQNNFSILPPVGNTPFIKWFGRWDTDLSANNRFSAAETESDNPSFGTDIFYPLNNQHQDVSRDNAQVSDVWTISSHTVNEARMGFTDQLNFFEPVSEGKNYPTLLDMPILKADAFPGGNGTGINISSFDGFTSASHSVYKEFVFDPSDVVTLIKGRHVLHLGGEFLINRADSTAWGNIDSGEFTLNGQYTAAGGGSTNAYDGMSYADFLLGQVNNWGGAKNAPEFAGRWKAPQLFVQDDFKVHPNLTVNLGVRWEGETGWHDAKGNEAVFDPAVQNFNFTTSGALPSAPVNGVAPGAPVQGGMWYGFLGQNGRTSLQAPKYDIFLPRFGFSWQIRPNTVIRGGIGMFASTWSEDTYGGGEGNAFGSSGGVSDTTDGICPVLQLSADGNSPDTEDPGCGVGNFNPTSPNSHYVTAPTTPWASNGGGPTYNEYHTPVPLNYQWNLTVEQEFLKDWAGSVSYVGNHGDHLNFPVDINQVPESKLGPSDAQYQPYPIFQGMTGSTNNAISNYHALQAVLTKRFSYGLQFSTNYTWSHFLDDQDSSGWGSREGWDNYQNSYAPSLNYSNSNFDIRHMFKGEAVYQLPFGKGMMFMNNNPIADEVLGGWQTAFTFVAQTGNPISITTGNNNSSNNQSGSYTQFANLVGNYKSTDSVTGNDYHSLKEWYNLQALAVPAPYTYGDFVRNTVYGPHLVNFNFSLGKSFDLWPEKGVSFQIRGMATNIFNHPNFGQPGNNAIGGGESAQITTIVGSGRLWEMYGRISF
jgi:Carboxypeptidase regulatory-like domain